MADPKPYLPAEAADVFPEGAAGDFLLPVVMPQIDALVGEALAIVVLTTTEGQRVGVPLGLQALYDLSQTVAEALRLLQAPEGGSVQ